MWGKAADLLLTSATTWVYIYRQTSSISHTLVGNKTVDHSDVVGASPVGAAPTTSSFSTAQNPKTWLFLVSSCSCPWPIHWSQVLSQEWKCSWNSADRQRSNYIWTSLLPTKEQFILGVWQWKSLCGRGNSRMIIHAASLNIQQLKPSKTCLTGCHDNKKCVFWFKVCS